MSVRVRFAPSPTGQVHIGNIRAAIFNYLFARHEQGAFLLRVEDTDRERSTPEAVEALLDVMAWLGLEPDEDPLYQSSRLAAHCDAAGRLQETGQAYLDAKGGANEAVVFRIPWNAEEVPGVSVDGPTEIRVHPEEPVEVASTGVQFSGVSAKGRPVPQAACLAGFRDLRITDANGEVLFELEPVADQILSGARTFTIEGAQKFEFTRRRIAYEDGVKGLLSKPLDSLKDLVVVRSDGSPVFHLANVCDDTEQGVTHIIRGDDHVENTFRHLFLFHALGYTPPKYAHLPMIVNAQGKPYSKRDGDAFVGEFRDNGILPEALFNYLTLLGWSPGDDREKMNRAELIDAFSLDSVQESAAQVDLRKLENLNGQYIAELRDQDFLDRAREFAANCDWFAGADEARFAEVATLLQTRTKRLTDVTCWAHFFQELPEYEAKPVRKSLAKPGIAAALERALLEFEHTAWTPNAIEAAVHATTAAVDLPEGKLNQPLRVAVTGTSVGAGIYETLAVLGHDTSLARIRHALTLIPPAGEPKQ